MSSSVIFVVGVGFDGERMSPGQATILSVCQQLGKKQITSFSNGSSMDEYRANGSSLINVFDLSRTLFGLRVADETEGRTQQFAVAQFLKNYGIDLPVCVWSWDPINKPDRCPVMVA